MASGDLFRPFSVRFSLKNERHVKILQKFNDNNLNRGKVKNQIVMDALEMYFNAMESNSATRENKTVTKQFFEQQLEQFKQECKGEMLRELFRFFVSSRMVGQPIMMSSSVGEPMTEEIKEDVVANISGMPDVIDKIMGWSDS